MGPPVAVSSPTDVPGQSQRPSDDGVDESSSEDPQIQSTRVPPAADRSDRSSTVAKRGDAEFVSLKCVDERTDEASLRTAVVTRKIARVRPDGAAERHRSGSATTTK